MRKIFLFEANRDITNLIKNSIKNEFDDDVRDLGNIEEALKEIAMGDYDLIIARNKVGEQVGLIKRFIESIEANSIPTVLISIGQVEIEHDSLIGVLPEKFNMSELISIVKNYFSGENASKDVSYIPIRIEILELMSKTDFDLFSLLKRPGNDDQYIKKFGAGDEIVGLSNLKPKGTKELFLNKRDRLQFTASLTKQISRKINIDFNELSELMSVGENVYRLCRKLISEQGTNEISYRLINCLADEMVGNLKKTKNNIGEYIYASIEHTTSYSYKHLNLIGTFFFISLPYIEMMEEKKELYLSQFIYATFFHDIILEKEGMAQIHTKKDWMDCEFGEKEKNLIRDHAKLASELLSKFPGSSSLAVQIVKEHHGVPSGIGFSDRKVGSLKDESVFFDVIHDFVELFINFPPDGSLEIMLKNLIGSYQLSVYKNYAKILKQGIIETFFEQA